MDQRIVTKHFQQTMHQATGKADWQIKKGLQQMAKAGDAGAKKAVALMGKTSLSRQETRELVGTLREAKILRNVGTEQMIGREDRRVAAEAEKAAEVKTKANIARQKTLERIESPQTEKGGALHNVTQGANIGHSAQEKKVNPARGEGAQIGALESKQQPPASAEKKEEKPILKAGM